MSYTYTIAIIFCLAEVDHLFPIFCFHTAVALYADCLVKISKIEFLLFSIDFFFWQNKDATNEFSLEHMTSILAATVPWIDSCTVRLRYRGRLFHTRGEGFL